MSQYLMCKNCHGRKKIVGLGMLERECPDCSGAGWSKIEDEIKPVIVQAEIVIPEIEKPILEKEEVKKDEPKRKRIKRWLSEKEG